MAKQITPTYEDRIRGLIKQHQAQYRLSPAEFALMCFMTTSTYYNRMRRPKDFTLEELLHVANVLNTGLDGLVSVSGDERRRAQCT